MNITTLLNEKRERMGIPLKAELVLNSRRRQYIFSNSGDRTEETDETEEPQEIKEIKEPKEIKETKELEGGQTQQTFQKLEDVPALVAINLDNLIAECKVGEDKDSNSSLFDLARAICRLEVDLQGKFSLNITAEIARKWMESNKANLIPNHDYHLELLDKLSLVRVPKGVSPLSTAFDSAKGMTPPGEVASFPLQFQWLVNLCRELQREAGGKPFYLDGRSAAEKVGIPHSTAASWLRALCSPRLGVLQEVFKGRTGKASRYKYLLPIPTQMSPASAPACA